MRKITYVYVVDRESGDGMEQDIFTEYELAHEWAQVVGATVREEPVLNRATVTDMTIAYQAQYYGASGYVG